MQCESDFSRREVHNYYAFNHSHGSYHLCYYIRVPVNKYHNLPVAWNRQTSLDYYHNFSHTRPGPYYYSQRIIFGQKQQQIKIQIQIYALAYNNEQE